MHSVQEVREKCLSFFTTHTLRQATAFCFVTHTHKLDTMDLGYFKFLQLSHPSLSSVRFNWVGYSRSGRWAQAL